MTGRELRRSLIQISVVIRPDCSELYPARPWTPTRQVCPASLATYSTASLLLWGKSFSSAQLNLISSDHVFLSMCSLPLVHPPMIHFIISKKRWEVAKFLKIMFSQGWMSQPTSSSFSRKNLPDPSHCSVPHGWTQLSMGLSCFGVPKNGWFTNVYNFKYLCLQKSFSSSSTVFPSLLTILELTSVVQMCLWLK